MGRVLVWVGGTFAAIGLALAAVGGWLYLEDRRLAAGGLRAHGTVIDVIASRDDDDDEDGGPTYTPVVEFHDADGARHVFTSRVSSNPPRYATGESVAVIYPRDAPDRALIDGFLERFFVALVFAGLGALFGGIGAGLLLVHRRGRAAADGPGRGGSR